MAASPGTQQGCRRHSSPKSFAPRPAIRCLRGSASNSPDGLSGKLTRIRDRSIVHEHVKPSKLLADALRCGGDRGLIRHVEMERVGVRPNLFGRGFAALEIARPNQESEAVCHEVLCDLKTYSLISSGNQSDGFVVHEVLLFPLEYSGDV